MRNTEEISRKNGIIVSRIGDYVMKKFENTADRREIRNYQILRELGVPTIQIIDATDDTLLMEDITKSETWRLGRDEDMSNPKIARAIAVWYKKLHEAGINFPALHELYDETDFITLANMDFIAEKTNTIGNPVWDLIRERFDDIRRMIEVLPRTLTYNDFYWSNLVVAKDGTSAMMFDFHLLGKGYVYSDVRNVTYSLRDEAINAFLDEYGTTNFDEKTADAIIEPLFGLYVACERTQFPEWAVPSLNKIKSEEYYELLRR
ncbi:MAG: aminoglycoside phosphotransferase family protein [Oscillospiraceae bacterium]|nr:aminoglycoside phosphotransferase family protein [Oscillospiraceae bacterium]